MQKLLAFMLSVALMAPVAVGADSVQAQAGSINANQAADVPAPKLASLHKTDPRFLDFHRSFVSIAKQGTGEVVFLGDSIMAGWRRQKTLFNKEFGKYNAVNFSISGDRTQHVLWRVENGEFDGFKPKAVVLMIGTNNSGLGSNPPEEVASGIRKIISAIHKRSPNTNILLHAIFPRGAEPMDDKNKRVNAIITKFNDGRRVRYLNINGRFLGANGQINRNLMPDLLHPNANGYAVWADAIRGTLAQIAR